MDTLSGKKHSGFVYVPCWHCWGNMSILVLWWENKHIFWIKWDVNIQNVLFCCGRKCLRTSLDNTRHASNLDSHSFTSPKVSQSLCRFQGSSRFKFLGCDCRILNILLWTALYICDRKTAVLFFFTLFLQDVPPPDMLRLNVFTSFSSSPVVQAVPLMWSDAVHVWLPSKKLSSAKTLSVSRTVGHPATLWPFYCFISIIWLCFSARISKLCNDFQRKHFKVCSTWQVCCCVGSSYSIVWS